VANFGHTGWLISIIFCGQFGSEYAIIGQETAGFYLISVPPGQTRQLDTNVYFSNLPQFKGDMNWSYSIKEVRGK
jgi:hypothetical protein